MHDKAAVDRQQLACDEAATLREQKQGRSIHVIGHLGALDRPPV
jgi:hypothetical protein